MTNNSNPFVVVPAEQYRGPYVDVAAVAKALADAWGAEVGECEPGSYGLGRVILGDLVVSIRADARKIGRISAGSGAPAITQKTGYSRDIEWPEANADTGRGIEKLAADLKRRVVDPAADCVAKAQAKLAGMNSDRANLERHAEALRTAFPFLDVNVPEDITKWEAGVSVYRDGFHLSGRLNANGGLYLDRTSTIPADRLSAVLAAIFVEA